jgi:hypothetical protein
LRHAFDEAGFDGRGGCEFVDEVGENTQEFVVFDWCRGVHRKFERVALRGEAVF